MMWHEERALLGGGEITLHSHPHTVTNDQRLRMNQLEKVAFISAHYSALPDDDILFVDSTAGAVTVTLPVAKAGQHIIVNRIAGANNVTLSRSGTDTINGATTLVISVSNDPVRLKAIDGLGYLEI